MITIKYQTLRYCYNETIYGPILTKEFASLEEVADWIFNQMEQKYSKMFFHVIRGKLQSLDYYPYIIGFEPRENEPEIIINEILENNKIIMSDGKLTNGQRHWNEEIQNWCLSCDNRTRNATFDFG